jgi:hypothetical protein
MNHTHLTKQVALVRKYYIERLMPDTCQLIPSKGTSITITDAGIVQQTPAQPREWRTLTNIPCRVDVSRAFRPDALVSQTVVVDEYNLQLPYDVTVHEDDYVIINGKTYEIRKLKQASEWDYTIEALIMKGSTQIDT